MFTSSVEDEGKLGNRKRKASKSKYSFFALIKMCIIII
jgi:hypothetical protein